MESTVRNIVRGVPCTFKKTICDCSDYRISIIYKRASDLHRSIIYRAKSDLTYRIQCHR